MYGLIKLLLEKEYNVQDTVLIESPFKEETRVGAFCNTVMLGSAILVMANSVQYNQHHFCRIVAANIHKYIGARSTYYWGSVIIHLNTLDDKCIFDTVPICVLFCRYALTPDNLVIATEKSGKFRKEQITDRGVNMNHFSLDAIYPLNFIKLAIFKRTRKQTLKVVFDEAVTRYFELDRMQGRKIFWRLWCHHVKEIRTNSSRWPYVTMKPSTSRINAQRWTDKYLYLGSKRDTEDLNRPIPIPGIGRTEEKLFYLKPQCIQYLDGTEDCVECHEEVQGKTYNYEDITYTDDPNSNITYTSLMTTVGIIGQF